MPVVAMFIGPLIALYVKYKLVAYAVKLTLFMAIYLSFKETMQFVINTIMAKMTFLQFPCMISYILNSLDIFPMVNFALSIWGTIYIGKFLYGILIRAV